MNNQRKKNKLEFIIILNFGALKDSITQVNNLQIGKIFMLYISNKDSGQNKVGNFTIQQTTQFKTRQMM